MIILIDHSVDPKVVTLSLLGLLIAVKYLLHLVRGIKK